MVGGPDIQFKEGKAKQHCYLTERTNLVSFWLTVYATIFQPCSPGQPESREGLCGKRAGPGSLLFSCRHIREGGYDRRLPGAVLRGLMIMARVHNILFA